MPDKKQPTAVYVSNRVHFDCGCMAEYPVIGTFAELNDWHIIPCRAHTDDRESLALLAQMALSSNGVTRGPKETNDGK